MAGGGWTGHAARLGATHLGLANTDLNGEIHKQNELNKIVF